MTWSTLNPDEPKTSYTSNSTDVKSVTEDIKIVVDKMIENRERDNATEADQLLFFINATNGYMRIQWCDFAANKALGDWVYWLELNDLWKGSENASEFDDSCFQAISTFTEYYMIDENEGGYVYEIFYRNELGGARQLKI